VPLSVLLRARGTPGHGSQPRPDSAVNRLVGALGRVLAWEPPIVVLPEVQRFYAEVAPTQPSPWRERLADLATALRDREVAAQFTRGLNNNARVRTTIAVTMLEGSNKVNVIPAEATARLDVRLLPGQDAAAFLDDLRRVVADDNVAVEAGAPFVTAGSSPIAHPLIDVIGAVVRADDPAASVQTSMLTGATDCRYFRAHSIPCYGFVPFALTGRDLEGFHGNDERVSVSNVVTGTRVLHEIVKRFAAD
jgi:acetylornithine deacetylase/succinyl-diaminopimelate desuccinylase-like protein